MLSSLLKTMLSTGYCILKRILKIARKSEKSNKNLHETRNKSSKMRLKELIIYSFENSEEKQHSKETQDLFTIILEYVIE